MIVSTNYNLIPYPDHNYQVLPYAQDNLVAHQDHGKESIEPHKLLRRSHSVIKSDSIDFDFRGNSYDATYRLQYANADQVGHLVDVYA
jgi:hypothetical protein